MNNFKFVSTLALCIIALIPRAQDVIKRYVQNNTAQISSIHPDATDYSDLEAIGKAIGNAKIVMLGEQDHGDAPGYFAKVRLIKYLHEKKGFNVVAFENDFFNTTYSWGLVKEGKMNVDTFVRTKISITWRSCGSYAPFFNEYVPAALNTNHPIEIAGFDNQTATPQALPLLDSVLRKLRLSITQTAEYTNEILPLLYEWHQYTKDTTAVDKIISHYKDIKTQLLEKLPENDFWVIAVDNLIQQNIQFRNWKKDYWKDMNTRDRQMAANLKWLAETKYPNEKIIVWAHNYHVSKYAGHYPEEFLNTANTMGSAFTEDTLLANETYIIGFTSYKGTAGRILEKAYKVGKPKPNSFENWINKEYDYAFVDFKRYYAQHAPAHETFFMKGSIMAPHHRRNHKAVWSKIFDGVFYIKENSSCSENRSGLAKRL